jgi:transcriptional regulator with XRE-family HTH domain
MDVFGTDPAAFRTPADVGRAVRAIREQRGWSQERLMLETNRVMERVQPAGPYVSVQWIMRLEKGQMRRTELAKLGYVAAALKVPLSQLVLRDGDADPVERAAQAIRATGLDPEEADALIADLKRRVARRAPPPDA